MATKTRTTYSLISADGETQTFARKDTAIRTGEKIGGYFFVETNTGKVVYESHSAEPEPEPEPKQPKAKRSSKPIDIEKQKEKIRMLLSKAESTTFEEERDTFNAAAEKMMLRLGLDIAELEAKGKTSSEEIVKETRVYTGIYGRAMITFAADIALGFGDVTVLSGKVNQRDRVLHVVGHRTDVDVFLAMLDSLVLQANSALVFHRKTLPDYYTREEKFVSNRSFMFGFSSMVRVRLTEERTSVFAEASTGAELVLASKKEKVDSWVQENMNPRKGRGGSRNHDTLSYLSGREEGAKATLNNKDSVDGKSKKHLR